MKSFMLTETQTNGKHFHITGKVHMGRLATQIAIILRGKHKTTYTPNVLCGDKVVVTNVKNVVCTTKNKVYYHHTSHPGGLVTTSYEDMLKKDVCLPLFMAVKRMLNKSKLRKLMLRNLYLFADENHTLNGYSLQKIEV